MLYEVLDMICNSILDAMGNTPIIRLSHLCDEDSAEVLVKFEGLNVGGSIKTRTAYNMILDAEKKGLINENTIIVEPTSGNQGIGLSLVGAVRGYKTVIIMPDSVNTLLHVGNIFDITVLDRERERIASYLRDRGYYPPKHG